MALENLFQIKHNQNQMFRDRGYHDFWTGLANPGVAPQIQQPEAYFIGDTVEHFARFYLGIGLPLGQEGYGIYVVRNILANARNQDHNFIRLTEEEMKLPENRTLLLTNIYISRDYTHLVIAYYTFNTKKNTVKADVIPLTFILNNLFINLPNGVSFRIIDVALVTAAQLHFHVSSIIHDLPGYNFQVFFQHELNYIPYRHFLVPRHRTLTSEEQTNFLESNQLTFDQIPKISTSEAVAKYYDFRPGQIIRIVRLILYEYTMLRRDVSFRAVHVPTQLETERIKKKAKKNE